MIRVALIEDQEDIREALSQLLDDSKGFKCAGSFADAESAIKQMEKLRPDVLLADISLPGMSGIDVIPVIRKLSPETVILMLTVHEEDDSVFASLCAGAQGYLVKTISPSRLLTAIQEVKSGGAPMSSHIARMVVRHFQKLKKSDLTPREMETLNLLCAGKSYKNIADEMSISRDTVHAHIKNIYRKLEVNSMSEAVAKAIKNKMI